jgi:Arc/MetJ-type ribon-helix-helix transcriptional regulator
MEKADRYVDDNPWGYRSRAEVVAAAVREFLQRAAEERGGWKNPVRAEGELRGEETPPREETRRGKAGAR